MRRHPLRAALAALVVLPVLPSIVLCAIAQAATGAFIEED